jgi:hypothetical protein
LEYLPLEYLPLNDDDSYTFGYNPKRGISLNSQKMI